MSSEVTRKARYENTSFPRIHSLFASSLRHHDESNFLSTPRQPPMARLAFHRFALFTFRCSLSNTLPFTLCTSTAAQHIALPASLLDSHLGPPHSFGNKL